LKILSELVLLLPNTDSFQQFEDFVRSCSTSTKVFSRSKTSSDKNLQIVESCLYLVEVEQALTKSSYQIQIAFNNLKILPDLVLLLPNTGSLQQFGDFCQRLFFYQILTAFIERCQYLVEDQALTKISKLLKVVSIW
jgi:hypothetical protein